MGICCKLLAPKIISKSFFNAINSFSNRPPKPVLPVYSKEPMKDAKALKKQKNDNVDAEKKENLKQSRCWRIKKVAQCRD